MSWLIPEDMWEYIGMNPTAAAPAIPVGRSAPASRRTRKNTSSAAAPQRAESSRVPRTCQAKSGVAARAARRNGTASAW